MNKTYVVNLRIVGEVSLVDGDNPADKTVDVASIRKDFGKIAEAICESSDLDAMLPRETTLVPCIDKSLPELMIFMLHLARDMDMGKFRGEAFAEAVKDDVLSGGSLRGDVAPEMLRQLERMGLTKVSRLVATSKLN